VLFRVLGPVEVESAGSVLSPARRQERCLLAILLLEAGRVVPVDRLCDLLWEENPPDHARRLLQSHAARIRGLLARLDGEVRLVSRTGGYLLEVSPDCVDAHRFRRLVRDAAEVDVPTRREELLRDALGLWRGPALQDAASDWLRERLCADVNELRLHAIEESMDAGIAMGRHLVAELAQLTAAHPTRERLIELHMVALQRAGRTAEALEVFARAREQLAERLGVEPGARLARLHQEMLRGEAPPAPPPVPRCLPRDISDFTGREEVLAHLLEEVSRSTVVAIDGMPGVGKTALAVRLAHRVAQRYPDGQLAIDLHGHSSHAPIEPAAALDRLLRQLGVAGDRIPDGLDARVELWRTELASRKVLLLLDNAATSDQIGPLVPPGPGCLTLVTSRRRLAGLDGAHSVALEVLSPDEAVALMHRIVGERVLADAAAAAEVARRCEYLTLAVRLAAARLAHRPSWTVRDLAGRLAALDEIAAEGRSVVAAFGLSYSQVSGGAQRMFRLLGLHPGPDIEVRAAASLADLELDAADAVLGELVDAHLLDEPVAGRYRLHDLLKEYAARLVGPEADRHQSLERLLAFYVHSAAAAATVIETDGLRFDYRLGNPPALAIVEHPAESAEAWLATERSNLTAAVRCAIQGGWHGHVWRLARATWKYLYRNGYHDDNLAMMSLVLEAARHEGSQMLAGLAHNYLAASYYHWGRWDEALGHIDEAIALRTESGDLSGLAVSIDNRTQVLVRSGRYAEARESSEHGLRTLAQTGVSPILLAHLQAELGLACLLMGDLEAAERHLRHHLAIAEERNADSARGPAYAHLGALELRRGRSAIAVAYLERALRLNTVGNPILLAETVCDLGSAHRSLGDLEQALQLQHQALNTTLQYGFLSGECEVRIELAITLQQFGDDEAKDHLNQALAITHRLNLLPQRAKALDVLAEITKDPTLHDEATAIYTQLGLPRPPTPPTLEG
jgi:DNA-binding SARP family transcriptional activator/tetratricopeptide (TPR) repeat protein